MRHKILPNQIFGNLTTLNTDGKDKYGNTKWKCLCSCGKVISVRGNSLITGNTTSCGCKRNQTFKQKTNKIIGKKFGKLTVVSLNEKVTQERQTLEHQKFYNCVCECGNTCVVGYSSLQKKQDCGCGEKVRRQHRIRKVIPSGSRFGNLVVLGVNETITEEKHREVYYDCICDCGMITTVARYALLHGKTKSCGCLIRKNCSKISRLRLSTSNGSVSKWETELIEYIKDFIGNNGVVKSQIELVNNTNKGKNLTFWYDCAITFKNGRKVIIEFNGSCWHAINPYQHWMSMKGHRTAKNSYSTDFIASKPVKPRTSVRGYTGFVI